MMKRNLFSVVNKGSLLTLALVALGCVGFSACGSDDDNNGNDDNGGGGGTSTGLTAGRVEANDGSVLLVTRVGETTFSYDATGKLTKAYDDGDNFTVTYSPLTFADQNDDFSDVYTVSFNGSGYASKMDFVCKEGDTSSDDYYDQDGSIAFAYDGSGHLTKLTGTSTYVYCEDGEVEKGKATMSCTFTWASSRLTKITYKAENPNADYSEDISFNYDGDGYENPLRQFANSYWGDCLFDDVQFLSYLGLLGKGGDYLPTSWTKIVKYNDEEDGSQGYAKNTVLSFEFYSNGSLRYEVQDGSRISYSYDVASASDATDASASQAKARQSRHRHSAFGLMPRSK